ncbi:MAG: uracil-DNA glycosylase [Bdellovibrionota bacterium]
MQEKFSLWKESLELAYGRSAFISKAWLERRWRAQQRVARGDAPPSRVPSQASAPASAPAPVPVPAQLAQTQDLRREQGQSEQSASLKAIQPVTERAAILREIQQEIGDCQRCKLCKTRKNIVFGEGSPDSTLMFVGEGPGEQEDLQGRPFVGKAGQLLDKIIEAMGLSREQVYIANVVKCRPPGNRVPEPDEAGTCEQFLFRQIDCIKPKVIVALGATALRCLLGGDVKITKMRGNFTVYRGTKLMPTYHPAFLLRNPEAKKEVWEDMKKVMAELKP